MNLLESSISIISWFLIVPSLLPTVLSAPEPFFGHNFFNKGGRSTVRPLITAQNGGNTATGGLVFMPAQGQGWGQTYQPAAPLGGSVIMQLAQGMGVSSGSAMTTNQHHGVIIDQSSDAGWLRQCDDTNYRCQIEIIPLNTLKK